MAEKREIELIPEKERAVRKQTRLLFVVRVVGLVLLGAAVLVVVLLLLAAQKQATALSDVQKQVAVREADLLDLAEVERKVLGLAAKDDALSRVFTQRNYYSLLLDALKKSIPGGVTVTDLSAAPDEVVTISGEVRGYVSLANFLRDLVDPEKGGSLFEEVSLTSVTFEPTEGTAQFSAEVTIKQDGLRGGTNE